MAHHIWICSNGEQTQPNFSMGAPPLTHHVAVVHKRTSFTLSVSLPGPLQAQRCDVQPCKNTYADTHTRTHTHNGVFPNTIKIHWCESNGTSLVVSFPESKAFCSLFVLHTLLFRLPPPPVPSLSISALPHHQHIKPLRRNSN